jgi:hypothetical protein
MCIFIFEIHILINEIYKVHFLMASALFHNPECTLFSANYVASHKVERVALLKMCIFKAGLK